MKAATDTLPDPQRRLGLRRCALGMMSMIAGPTRAARSTPLRILCSGPAGSIPDLVARSAGEAWALAAGTGVVVDNRPGAAGLLSIAALKAAPADGSTLLLAQGAIATVYPALYDKLAYDATLDLQPVSLASEMSLALAVGPAVPDEVTTWQAFVDWARRHPASVNIGSPGIGTLPHLLSALLMHERGLAWQHVPYAGGPPAVTALLGGQIAALVLPEGLLRQHHASRRLRVLVTSGAVRSVYLPDVPSLAEQGHPALAMKEWFAFFAPGATPQDVVARLAADLQMALAQPAVAATFAQAGMVAASSTPAALARRIAAEQSLWQPLLRARGIRAE